MPYHLWWMQMILLHQEIFMWNYFKTPIFICHSFFLLSTVCRWLLTWWRRALTMSSGLLLFPQQLLQTRPDQATPLLPLLSLGRILSVSVVRRQKTWQMQNYNESFTGNVTPSDCPFAFCPLTVIGSLACFCSVQTSSTGTRLPGCLGMTSPQWFMAELLGMWPGTSSSAGTSARSDSNDSSVFLKLTHFYCHSFGLNIYMSRCCYEPKQLLEGIKHNYSMTWSTSCKINTM